MSSRERARRCGRSPGAVFRLFHENFELIARARERLGRILRDDLAATALEVQQTIRHLLALIRAAEDPIALAVALAPAIFELSKCGAINAERYSLLAEAAQKIEPAGVATAEERTAAEVRRGTRRNALLYSGGVNATHDLRQTNEDKRRAVLTLLQDDEWMKWSDHEIARRCAVSPMTVGRIRKKSHRNKVILSRAPTRRSTAPSRR